MKCKIQAELGSTVYIHPKSLCLGDSSLEQHHDHACESQSLLCLVQEQHGCEEMGMLAEL